MKDSMQEWRKSTYSGTDNDCVELLIEETSTGIRDTKNRNGGSLTFSTVSWQKFLGTVQADELHQ
jgi:hypothetical protein